MITIDQLKFSQMTLTNFEEKITRNQPFISWGSDNMFVEELYKLLDASPIHNSAVRARVDNCVGSGYINDYKINSKQYLNDVAKQMYFELIVSGNLFLEVVWRKDRKEGIAGFHVIPSKYMRIHKPEEMGQLPDKYLYCRDWKQWRKAGIVEFGELDPTNYSNRQVVHLKQYQPGYDYYGVPSYMSTINDIKLNHEITVYNLANIINGCSMGLWVHFNQPAPDSEQEQTAILNKIEDRYMGGENANKLVVSYGEDGDGKPEITQIPTNVEDGYFSNIFELVQHQILAGHNIPDGSIIGLPQRTGFSSSADQLETAYKIFINRTIVPMQDFLNRELTDILQLVYPNEQINLEITQNPIV